MRFLLPFTCLLVSSTSMAAGPPSFLASAYAVVPESFTGEVVEVLHVPGYTYVRIDTTEGESRWIVTLGKEVALNAQVSVRPFGELTNFYSKGADRTFDRLAFAMLGVL